MMKPKSRYTENLIPRKLRCIERNLFRAILKDIENETGNKKMGIRTAYMSIER